MLPSNAQRRVVTEQQHNAVSLLSDAASSLFAVPPEITRPPLSIRRLEGDDAEFDCQMRGTPYPTTRILWMKEAKPLDVSTHVIPYCTQGGRDTVPYDMDTVAERSQASGREYTAIPQAYRGGRDGRCTRRTPLDVSAKPFCTLGKGRHLEAKPVASVLYPWRTLLYPGVGRKTWCGTCFPSDEAEKQSAPAPEDLRHVLRVNTQCVAKPHYSFHCIVSQTKEF